VQDRQHDSIAGGIEEFVRMPRSCQRAGLGFAVADDAGHDEIRVIERRTESVR